MTRAGGPRVLDVRGVAKTFGGLHALSGIDLQVHQGECVAVIGPNGAGKTTLFNILSGLLRPTAGAVRYLGADITRLPLHRRAALGIGRTMQITSVFREVSVIENVLIGVQRRHRPWRPFGLMSLGGDALHEEAEAVLRGVGLADKAHERCGALAYGDQRLVELALVLAGRPRLLLLDEPTAGLSPGETSDITERLRRTAIESETTLVIVEHDMEVVMHLASRVVVLQQGRCIADGAPDDVMQNADVRRVYFHGASTAQA